MIEHSRDFRRVKRLCNHPLIIDRRVTYLVETDGVDDLGVWSFHPYADGLQVHVTMSEKCRGKAAADSAREAFGWIFNHNSVNNIYAASDRKDVSALAIAVGFKFIGTDDDGDRLYKLERDQQERLAG